MDELKLCESDYRFMDLIWEYGPIGSGALVALSEEKLGWKKSTTYTVLKKLCQRGFAENSNAVVTALIPRERVRAYESNRVVERTFAGSLPGFLAAFLGEKRLTAAEAAELKKLIEEHEEV